VSRFLLLCLREELEVASIGEKPQGTLRNFGTEYSHVPMGPQPVGFENFLGFYDWLRNKAGGVLGLRLWVADSAGRLNDMIPKRQYIQHQPDLFTISFRPLIDIDEEASMDQDFGHSRVFMSADGEVVLSLRADGLSDDELASLTD
jgi:hypothetical protein